MQGELLGAGSLGAAAIFRLSAGEHVVNAELDQDARFELSLDPAHWELGQSYRASVGRGQAESLFQGPVVLSTQLSLQARRHYRLRGRLESNLDLRDQPLFVHARVLPRSAGQEELLAGMGQLNLLGEFELEAWVDREERVFRLALGGAEGFFCVEDVPTAQLTSAEGALLSLELGRLQMFFIDGKEQPLSGVDVRLYASALDSAQTWLTAVSDVEGKLSFLLQSGQLEYCAGKLDHHFASARFAWDALVGEPMLHVMLPRLGAADALSGRVFDPTGLPVAGAFVSAGPRTQHPDLSVAALHGQRSDAEGRFRLPIAGDSEVELSAYRKDLGMTSVTLPRAEGQQLSLHFEPLGQLEVRLNPGALDLSQGVELEWLLLARPSGPTRTGTSRGLELRIEELPPGAYELWLRSLDQALFGTAQVQVDAGEPLEIEPQLRPGFILEGQLFDARGKPLAGAVLRLHGGPAEGWIDSPWGSAIADTSGGFRLFSGASELRRALVYDSGMRPLGELQLVPATSRYELAD